MRTWLLAIQGSLAVNALVGGLLLMLAPDGSLLQLPLNFMHSTLFADYFWPGVILFVVLGLGHCAGFVLTLRRAPMASRAALTLGATVLTQTRMTPRGGSGCAFADGSWPTRSHERLFATFSSGPSQRGAAFFGFLAFAP